MELGEKIRNARQNLGLSQRQLCGEKITRNMLSLIENGAAKPSMKTLALLAERLGKPMSYFLDDDPRDPGELITSADHLRKAEQALEAGKDVYARQLLEAVTAPELLREKLLLAAKIPGADIAGLCGELPPLDVELLLRAEGAFLLKKWDRCEALLAAAEDRENPAWDRMMGRVQLARGNYSEALTCLLRVEEFWPVETARELEICCRELGDYKRAYEYACKQK